MGGVIKEVKIDKEKQLIRVQFDSNSTVEDWKKALVKVERLSKETGICRVLIDVRRQITTATTTTLFDFGARLPHSIAFAVLCDLLNENHRFIETVAKNRGIRVQDFNSEKKAIEWLEKRPNKKSNHDKLSTADLNNSK